MIKSLLIALALVPQLAFSEVVWRGDFETGNDSQWDVAQRADASRIRIVGDPVRQGQYAVRVTVKQGDNPISSSGNRNELVYNAIDREGSEYYYKWSTMFANDYPSDWRWQVFTQWHSLSDTGGSPPIEFDVYGENIILMSGPAENVLWSAPLKRGRWHDFIFHVKWSTSSSVGFVELYYDGNKVLNKTHVATGHNVYLKQGLYRSADIRADGTVFHDAMVKATSLDDVIPGSPPADPTPPADPPPDSPPNSPPVTTPPPDPTNVAVNKEPASATIQGTPTSNSASAQNASTSTGASSKSNNNLTATAGCAASGASLPIWAAGLLALFAVARRQKHRL